MCLGEEGLVAKGGSFNQNRLPTPPEIPSDVAALYRTYASWVNAFLARRFGREIAEDLAQETSAPGQHPMDWRSPKSLLAGRAQCDRTIFAGSGPEASLCRRSPPPEAISWPHTSARPP